MRSSKLTKYSFALFAACATSLWCASVAQALPLTGEIWQNVSDPSNANDPANTSGGTHANFTPGSIAYDSRVTGYTPFLFLNGVTFTSPTGGFDPNGSMNNSLIVITGTIGLTAGLNSFILTHDDGAILDIAGITGASNPACTGAHAGAVLCEPGPTPPTVTPFNVSAATTGNYNFTLTYNECCGPPAVLLFEVNNVVVGAPEPATLALLGVGLAGLGFSRRRKLN